MSFVRDEPCWMQGAARGQKDMYEMTSSKVPQTFAGSGARGHRPCAIGPGGCVWQVRDGHTLCSSDHMIKHDRWAALSSLQAAAAQRSQKSAIASTTGGGSAAAANRTPPDAAPASATVRKEPVKPRVSMAS